MTVLAARPARTAAPRANCENLEVFPVVREIVGSGDPMGAVFRT